MKILAPLKQRLQLRKNTPGPTFIPDFCSIKLILSVVIIGQLFSFIIVLSKAHGNFWQALGLVSLFVQWTVIVVSALLCLIRKYFHPYNDFWVSLFVFWLILFVVFILSKGCIVFNLHGDHAQYFMQHNLAISAILITIVLHYFYVVAQWKLQMKSESEARFQALQSRIRPHFLFNSMNTIACLITAKPELAEEMLEDLASLFRICITDTKKMVSLEDEVILAKQYLNIEKMRLAERLQLIWHIEPYCLQASIPSLTLQPLLENAVYHGIEPLTMGGEISIHICYKKGCIEIAILNPKPVQPSYSKNGTHIAVENIKQRLNLAYGTLGNLLIKESENSFRVVLSFPFQKENK